LLYFAFFGACLILCGLISIIVQLVVSIRHRAALRDTTGDPWNGRTLEWATPSPPPAFNFARIPIVESLDALAYGKQHGGLKYGPVEPIDMPNRTPIGLFIGVLAFLASFGIIWYMWWLAILAVVAIFVLVIIQSSDDNNEHLLSVGDIRAIMKKAGQPLPEGGSA